jgi:hypothetical protein
MGSSFQTVSEVLAPVYDVHAPMLHLISPTSNVVIDKVVIDKEDNHSGKVACDIGATPVTSLNPDPTIFLCGSIPCKPSLEINREDPRLKPRFVGADFWHNCKVLPFPKEVLELALDLRQADCPDEEVSIYLNIFGLPSEEVAFNILGSCHICNESSHVAKNCMEFTRKLGPFSLLNDKSLSGPMRCCFLCGIRP